MKRIPLTKKLKYMLDSVYYSAKHKYIYHSCSMGAFSSSTVGVGDTGESFLSLYKKECAIRIKKFIANNYRRRKK